MSRLLQFHPCFGFGLGAFVGYAVFATLLVGGTRWNPWMTMAVGGLGFGLFHLVDLREDRRAARRAVLARYDYLGLEVPAARLGMDLVIGCLLCLVVCFLAGKLGWSPPAEVVLLATVVLSFGTSAVPILAPLDEDRDDQAGE